MKRITFILSLLLTACTATVQEYDICIYGGTSSGVIAAKAAALLGRNVVIIEPSGHIGGMTTGGLGQTDIGNKQVVEGLSRKFYRDLGKHYGTLEKWVFEPHVAADIFEGYLDDPHITIRTRTGLLSVNKQDARILSIRVGMLTEDGHWRGKKQTIRAGMFIDASYEGDLMAAAGVSHTIGRESAITYGESWNGRHLSRHHQFPDGIDPYKQPGDSTSGLLWGISADKTGEEGEGDALLQAYNFRICLTDSLENQIPLRKPEGYDASRYELLARLLAVQGDGTRYFIWDNMPCRKTDINNFGGFSTDLIGGNYDWPTASYERRHEIWKAHYDYTIGLLWFMQTDPRVSASLQAEYRRWGLPKDEYPCSGHWTPQLYVREGRRMVSDYVITQADCEGRTDIPDAVAMAAYQMDSHNCRRIVVDGQVRNEGDVQIKTPGPYPIPLRSILPKRAECTNLAVPVCLSASHIAFGSIRMEPVFMTLGQVAAMVADKAIAEGIPLQDVPAADIRDRIMADPCLDGSAPDILIDDLDGKVSAPRWERVRKNRGYGPTYLELPVSGPDAPVVFNGNIPATGRYALYSYLNLKDSVAPVTHYRIENAGQIRQITVDARTIPLVGQTKGEWASLGEYDFAAGSVKIVLTGESQPFPLRADAVLIIAMP